ncbi:hypothetical protein DDB_G0274271 [Dictyostelium discoideum AX4]|uniref:Putative uncharacterized protein DDB_G0274271 n=1 Tax=Dictyostelium discoideum TaxID=44689 RepID=Y7843_DICDI|nr:hypothetical protein DDB_G0274271 [Dictyostelium discoideum AX4]Q86J13.1 RecName: Full=Putative uncharacterized protein DDB_G0274271 [Dictyostelium discoideum]EAL70028.1 hypothetical protein DDB_G0274271 [Dictyostelium discoideum AX4]|eukprot:XP_643974.1 hypothetical protein DDB_G0274271 [Dictyostelium discoideum AX4]
MPHTSVKKTKTNINQQKYIENWEGYEHVKRKLIKLRMKYKCSSNSLKRICGGEELIHNTLSAMNGNTYKIKHVVIDPSTPVVYNLKRHNHLSAYITRKYNFSPFLVEKTKDDLFM